MKIDQLVDRREAIDRKAEMDKRLTRSIEERAQHLKELSAEERREKTAEAAMQAAKLADALMKARPSSVFSEVDDSNAWNHQTKQRFIRLGQLGTYHICRDDDEVEYSLTRINPDADLDKDHAAFLANPHEVVDGLTTISANPFLGASLIEDSPKKIAFLQEGLETLQTLCEAAGVTVEAEAATAAV
jgi:hypothetical protein